MRSYWLCPSWLAVLSLCWRSLLAQDAHGTDLFTFVTRPDLRPPRLNILTHDAGRVTPGYWFMSPYVDITPEKPSRVFSPSQVGPQIFDCEGQLVWSGAPLVDQRTVFDFRVFEFDGEQYLSYLLNYDDAGREFSTGAGFLLDNTYTRAATVQIDDGRDRIDPHELNILNETTTALVIWYRVKAMSIADLGLKHEKAYMVVNGIQEIDLETGKVLFDWSGADHIPASESTVDPPPNVGQEGVFWDYLHMNSVEKTASGDYIFSARHINGIYKVSRDTGSILWRLGGKSSSFVLNGFNFSSQHDARVRYENSTHTILSFFDNGSDGNNATSTVSSAMLVSLDTSAAPMTATLIRKWERPDGGLSHARGNVQNLPSGNILVGWGSNGYLTEFSETGESIQESRFTTGRFEDYRIYKFNFTGYPEDPPDLVAHIYGTSREAAITVAHVSWNGATEVRSWSFYGAHCTSCPFTYIGDASKTGFETMYTTAGLYRYMFVEGITSGGKILGKSDIQLTNIPDSLTSLADTHPGVEQFEESRMISPGDVASISKVAAARTASASVYTILVGLTMVSVSALFLSWWKARSLRGYVRLTKQAD